MESRRRKAGHAGSRATFVPLHDHPCRHGRGPVRQLGGLPQARARLRACAAPPGRLLPLGLYLTGLTKFLSDLVFSPVKWAGVAVLGLGALLYVTSGVMLRRGAGEGAAAEGAEGRARRARPPVPRPQAAVEKRKPSGDPDLAEIEQILKNRGIS